MPNPLRGDVALPLVAALEGRPAVLRFDFDALCTVERVLDLKVTALGIEHLISPSGLRSIIAAGLARNHGALSVAIAGNVIAELGRTDAITAANDALRLAFPAPSASVTASTDDGSGWDWWKCFEMWCEFGLSPDDFWGQTPRTFTHVVAAQVSRAGNDQDRYGWLAWTTAALSRAKKLPRLEKVLRPRRPNPKRSKPKPWQEQLAAWGATLGRGKKRKPD